MFKRRKVKSTYKQMAFETAIRNPERYKGILTAVNNFKGRKLDDSCLLEIVCNFYINGIVGSDEIKIDEQTTIENIKDKVIDVNSTRRADGGFPSGYQSRFWTYMRTLSEFGFVYARYGEILKISEIAKKLINNEIDEQQAFTVQSMLCNRKSPYRNISNDYNYFRFILEVLINLHNKNKALSFNQFIVSTFEKTGNVDEFIKLIDERHFTSDDDILLYIREQEISERKIQTMFSDYPDVVLRLLRITGFVTIESRGITFIRINEEKIELIKSLLNIEYVLSEQEKENPILYYNKINNSFTPFLSLVKSHEDKDQIDGFEYLNKLENIIVSYNMDADKISENIMQIGTRISAPEFKYIPEPLKLEFFISLLIYVKHGKEYAIRPNYKTDSLGMPTSHAPGNKGDIEIYSKTIYWLIEVTLIRNKTQQINSETTSVIRHLLKSKEFEHHSPKYLSFVAPYIHYDTNTFYEFSIFKMNKEGEIAFIKPYTIKEFVEITNNKMNFNDMQKYTESYLTK